MISRSCFALLWCGGTGKWRNGGVSQDFIGQLQNTHVVRRLCNLQPPLSSQRQPSPHKLNWQPRSKNQRAIRTDKTERLLYASEKTKSTRTPCRRSSTKQPNVCGEVVSEEEKKGSPFIIPSFKNRLPSCFHRLRANPRPRRRPLTKLPSMRTAHPGTSPSRPLPLPV